MHLVYHHHNRIQLDILHKQIKVCQQYNILLRMALV